MFFVFQLLKSKVKCVYNSTCCVLRTLINKNRHIVSEKQIEPISCLNNNYPTACLRYSWFLMAANSCSDSRGLQPLLTQQSLKTETLRSSLLATKTSQVKWMCPPHTHTHFKSIHLDPSTFITSVHPALFLSGNYMKQSIPLD